MGYLNLTGISYIKKAKNYKKKQTGYCLIIKKNNKVKLILCYQNINKITSQTSLNFECQFINFFIIF